MFQQSAFMNKFTKVLLFTFTISGFVKLYAADITRIPINYVTSESIFNSSATCAASGSISTFSVTGTLIYGVDITSAGANGANVQLFNSNNSTQVAGTAINTPIDASPTMKSNWHPFQFFASTGVALNNSAPTGTPACITIYYYDRQP